MIMPRPFSENSNYRAEIRVILRLHRLWLDGKGESAEADALRDAADGPWLLLSDAERKRIWNLSQDLNSIESHLTATEMNPQAQAKLVEAYEARQRGDWDRALELLRRWGKFIPPAMLSYLRGSIWFEAGDAETAAVFYEHAAHLEPGNGNFRAQLMTALQRTDPKEALGLAEEVLQNPERYDPGVVVQAAHALFESTKQMSTSEAVPTYRRLIGILTPALERLEQESEPNDTARSASLSMLGLGYECLEDKEKALVFYSRALQIDPRNDALLVARGMLLYGASARAIADFELAIQTGTSLVWPYFFLAHHYLTTSRFEDCRSICERGLRRTSMSLVISELFEWLAISQAALIYPIEVVRASFENALRAEPSNDSARRNLATYEQSLVGHAQPASAWEKRSASVLRTFGREEMRKSNGLSAHRELTLA